MAGTQGVEGIGIHQVAGKCMVNDAWEPMQGCSWEGAVRIVVHSGTNTEGTEWKQSGHNGGWCKGGGSGDVEKGRDLRALWEVNDLVLDLPWEVGGGGKRGPRAISSVN